MEAQIWRKVRFGCAVNIEVTDDPHPRNTYWDMWGLPMFDLGNTGPVMTEIGASRKANPDDYIRVSAFDASQGWETIRLSFIVNRPKKKASFALSRQDGRNRETRYSVTTR